MKVVPKELPSLCVERCGCGVAVGTMMEKQKKGRFPIGGRQISLYVGFQIPLFLDLPFPFFSLSLSLSFTFLFIYHASTR